MLALAPNFTQKEYSWPNWKLIQVKKNFIFQHDDDGDKYTVYGYDGPEVHIAFIYKGAVPSHLTVSQETNDSYKADFEANFLSKSNKSIDIIKSNPFAEPLFRTKFNAIESIVDCAPGETIQIDFKITQELYIMGGLLLTKNTELGDFVDAEVIDKDGVIPEPYRPAICEAWPSVAKYIDKCWVSPTGKTEVNTYPLNAKISAGLYLRVTYHASNEGIARRIGMNYYLSKRL